MADIVVRIMGKDDLTPILKRIADSSEKTAAALKKAGAEGGKGMDEIGKKARSADTQLRTFERTSLAVGAAAGALALGVIRVSAAYQQQERQLAAISRLYGEAGDEVIRYAETIQATTKFSNDAARDSAVVLNTLVTNYGLATDQVEQLISRSADLAQLHGRSLQEVTQMVSNALRGEGEYIEQIGVSMNQTFVAAEAAARGMGNFISGMTQAEQAAFRFQLLMEQTAAAQGYAMETATGTRGAIGLLINEFGDAGQAIGSFLGPVRDLAGEFQNYALWMPLIASQTARMTAIMVNSARSGQMAATSMSLLRLAVSPLGIAVIAATTALGFLGLKFLENKQAAAQAAQAAEAAAQSYRTLQDSISQMYLSGNRESAEWVSQQNKDFQSALDGWNEFVEGVAAGDSDDGWFTSFSEGLFRGIGTGIEWISFSGTMADGLADAMKRAADEGGEEGRAAFVEAMTFDDAEQAQINQSLTRLFSLADNPNIDLDRFQAETSAFFAQLWKDVAAGVVPPENVNDEIDAFYDRMARTVVKIQDLVTDFDFQSQLDDLRIEGLDEVADDLVSLAEAYQRIKDAQFQEFAPGMAGAGFFDPERFSLSLEQLALIEVSMDRIGDKMESGDFDNSAINDQIERLTELFLSGQISSTAFANAMAALANDMDTFKLNTDSATSSTNDFNAALGKTKSLAQESATALKELNETRNQEQQDALNAYKEQLLQAQADFASAYAEAFGFDDPLSKINLSSLRNEFTALAGDITAAGNQMDTVFRVIVGNTNAIASSASGIYDWAAALIGAAGTVAEIDNLLATGAITLDQYTAAQTAYNQIAVANLSIQQSVLAVQAQQAPFIADFVSQQAELMRQLEGQSDVQQRITLGWMDSATATQAYTLMTQAAAVANGEMGAAGAEAFHEMIEGAIAVNPFLFDMLESIGLINGTPLDFQVNFEGVSEGMSEIERLTLSIDALTTALGGVPPDIPIGVDVQGQEDLLGLKDSLEGLDSGDREINVKVGMSMGESGGPLDGLIGSMFGGGAPEMEPITVDVDVVPNWGGGIDSLFGNGSGTGTAPALDPIPVEVIPEVDDSALQAAIPTGTVPGPIVQFGYDISLLTGALASYAGVEVAGPEIVFGADDTEPQMVLDQFGETSGEYLGPTFVFGANDIEPARTLGEWVSKGSVTGPEVVFGVNGESPMNTSLYWQTLGSINGPIVTFDSDDAAPSSDLGEWVGYGAVGGPTIVFSADTSAVQAALANYSGTSVIGTRIVNVVTQTSTVSLGTIKRQHGGIASYEHGGVVIHAAENNRPETLHFAHGGTARIETEGDYLVQRGDMVSPSNVDRGSGRNIYVSIQTGDWYGGSRPDLDDWAADTLIPAIADEWDRSEKSSGRAA